MKVLTVRQPWAWAIIHGGKDIENRSWSPPSSLIGERFAIHAALSFDRQAVALIPRHLVWPAGYARGAIIGTVKLERVSLLEVGLPTVGPGARQCGDWGDASARVHWHLADASPLVGGFEITVRGRLGLWEFSLPREERR